MRNKKKAQVSVEFLLLIAFIIGIFTILMGMFGQKLYDIQNGYQRERVEDVLRIISDETKVASVSENGYSKNIKINRNLLGENYTIGVDGKRVLWIQLLNSDARYLVLQNNTIIDAIAFINSSQTYSGGNNDPGYFELKIEKINNTVVMTNCVNCKYSYYYCQAYSCAGLTTKGATTEFLGIDTECKNLHGNPNVCI